MKILHKVYEEQERAREEFERQEGLMSSKPIIDVPVPQDADGVAQDLKMDCGTECMPGRLEYSLIIIPNLSRVGMGKM